MSLDAFICLDCSVLHKLAAAMVTRVSVVTYLTNARYTHTPPTAAELLQHSVELSHTRMIYVDIYLMTFLFAHPLHCVVAESDLVLRRLLALLLYTYKLHIGWYRRRAWWCGCDDGAVIICMYVA